MSILRKVSVETKQISLDDTDFIVVKTDISKREFNILAGKMPQTATATGGMSLTEALDFQTYLFSALVVEWSLDGAPTVEAYEGLSAVAGNAIDEKLALHFETLLPSSAEGK